MVQLPSGDLLTWCSLHAAEMHLFDLTACRGEDTEPEIAHYLVCDSQASETNLRCGICANTQRELKL